MEGQLRFPEAPDQIPRRWSLPVFYHSRALIFFRRLAVTFFTAVMFIIDSDRRYAGWPPQSAMVERHQTDRCLLHHRQSAWLHGRFALGTPRCTWASGVFPLMARAFFKGPALPTGFAERSLLRRIMQGQGHPKTPVWLRRVHYRSPFTALS